jgi:tRNA threonylcarbamoyladenosine biosynthesis protein TsaB
MNLLAIETSTDTMSLGLQCGGQVFLHTSAGGALASSTLIPAIESLLAQAHLRYAQLDAIVFGRGPGAFTGLRTACSVVQGLAYGADRPVLPVDTLLAVAQEALLQTAALGHSPTRILAALDARMGEVYAECYAFDSYWRASHMGSEPKKPSNLEQLRLPLGTVLAGNIRPVHEAALPASILALPYVPALPTASALLQLAPALIAQGARVDAQDALPLYIRDKVALTTLEREAQREANRA